MKTVFELWSESCVKMGTELYPLETGKSAETGLYQTRSQYMQRGYVYYNSPVYHIWIDGKSVASTTNYLEALNLYRNRIKELI